MIFAFDFDGTIVEAWYGKNTPWFYTDRKDVALRSSITDCYLYAKPLPYINPFLQNARDLDEKHRFIILSKLGTGAEFIQKIYFTYKQFIDKNNNPFFDKKDIYGTVSDEDKIHILESFAELNDVVYFDDTLSLLHKINQLQLEKEPNAKHILSVHASSLAIKSPTDIINAYEMYNEAFIHDDIQR